MTPLAYLLSLPVRAYRVLFSPWVGFNCRYQPTCSQYALEALETHGGLKGAWLTARRIGRCHPLGSSGYDPVPGTGGKKMQRARTLEDYDRIGARLATDAGVEKGLAYQPDPTDIFITPYAKCGTTWMQQIVHGLRTGGDMAFDEITRVVPWVELAHDMGLDLHAPQRARPHAFKSHLNWEDIPKGGRYIVVLRDPVDAMISMHRFMEGWFLEPGAVPLEEFALHYLDRPDWEGYWGHAVGWWGQRDNADVLMFAYEHMKQDLSGTVARVAAFMGGYDEARVALATEQAGFDFMKSHAGQFDDNLLRATRDAACGLPTGEVTGKVNEGRAGQGRAQLSEDVLAAFDAKWNATMGKVHGLGGYQDVLAALK